MKKFMLLILLLVTFSGNAFAIEVGFKKYKELPTGYFCTVLKDNTKDMKMSVHKCSSRPDDIILINVPREIIFISENMAYAQPVYLDDFGMNNDEFTCADDSLSACRSIYRKKSNSALSIGKSILSILVQNTGVNDKNYQIDLELFKTSLSKSMDTYSDYIDIYKYLKDKLYSLDDITIYNAIKKAVVIDGYKINDISRSDKCNYILDTSSDGDYNGESDKIIKKYNISFNDTSASKMQLLIDTVKSSTSNDSYGELILSLDKNKKHIVIDETRFLAKMMSGGFDVNKMSLFTCLKGTNEAWQELNSVGMGNKGKYDESIKNCYAKYEENENNPRTEKSSSTSNKLALQFIKQNEMNVYESFKLLASKCK